MKDRATVISISLPGAIAQAAREAAGDGCEPLSVYIAEVLAERLRADGYVDQEAGRSRPVGRPPGWRKAPATPEGKSRRPARTVKAR